MENPNLHFVFLVCIFLFKNNIVGADSNLRIIGGNKAKIEDHPWIVSLSLANKSHVCGGSLLNEDTIVTAAHCFNYAREKIVPEYVVAGVSKRSQAKKFIKIKKYTLYKKYIKFNFDYDIAIVKLAEKVKFSKKIQPIPLPEQDAEVPTGSIVTAAGWGRTENITESDHLLEISTKIADRQTCESFAPGQITDRMICAENIAEKKSTCSGDSGGPLVYNGTLIGVVSWGDELCREYIGVYTNVGYFSTWIKKKGGL